MIVIKLILFFAFVGISFAICGWKLAVAIGLCGIVALIAILKKDINKSGKADSAAPTDQAPEPKTDYTERKNLLSSQAATLHKQLEYYEDLINNESDPAKLMKYYTHQNRIYKELDSIHAKIDKING